MKKSKKLFISFNIVSIALILALSITVVVLAAKTATVNSGIQVGYTSTEVAATVSATYQTTTDSKPTSLKTSGDATTISFKGSDTTATGTFTTPTAISLASNNTSIVFVYTFKNDGDTSFTIDGTIPSTQTNVTIAATSDNDTSDQTNAAANTITNNAITQITVAGGKTAEITITVTITDVAKNSEFSGNFAWTLKNTVANQNKQE